MDKKYYKEDGSLDIEAIDNLPIMEHIKASEQMTMEEHNEYWAHHRQKEYAMMPMEMDEEMEKFVEECCAVSADDFLKELRAKSGYSFIKKKEIVVQHRDTTLRAEMNTMPHGKYYCRFVEPRVDFMWGGRNDVQHMFPFSEELAEEKVKAELISFYEQLLYLIHNFYQCYKDFITSDCIRNTRKDDIEIARKQIEQTSDFDKASIEYYCKEREKDCEKLFYSRLAAEQRPYISFALAETIFRIEHEKVADYPELVLIHERFKPVADRLCARGFLVLRTTDSEMANAKNPEQSAIYQSLKACPYTFTPLYDLGPIYQADVNIEACYIVYPQKKNNELVEVQEIEEYFNQHPIEHVEQTVYQSMASLNNIPHYPQFYFHYCRTQHDYKQRAEWGERVLQP